MKKPESESYLAEIIQVTKTPKIPQLKQRNSFIKPLHGFTVEEIRLRRVLGRKMKIDNL